MAHIIAIANQKEGVGKTTSTVNLTATIAQQDKKVLAIDLDPQASLTISMGQDPRALEAAEKTISYGLMDNVLLKTLVIPGSPALLPSCPPALLPSSIRLSKADMSINRSYTPATVLRKHTSHRSWINTIIFLSTANRIFHY